MLRGLPLSGFKFLQGALPHRPAWVLSLYECGIVFKGPLPRWAIHIQKASYTGTTDVAQWWACIPSTIIIAGGLVHPPPWCGRRFPAVGQMVNRVLQLMINEIRQLKIKGILQLKINRKNMLLFEPYYKKGTRNSDNKNQAKLQRKFWHLYLGSHY